LVLAVCADRMPAAVVIELCAMVAPSPRALMFACGFAVPSRTVVSCTYLTARVVLAVLFRLAIPFTRDVAPTSDGLLANHRHGGVIMTA